jgi:hypothetical protein
LLLVDINGDLGQLITGLCLPLSTIRLNGFADGLVDRMAVPPGARQAQRDSAKHPPDPARNKGQEVHDKPPM